MFSFFLSWWQTCLYFTRILQRSSHSWPFCIFSWMNVGWKQFSTTFGWFFNFNICITVSNVNLTLTWCLQLCGNQSISYSLHACALVQGKSHFVFAVVQMDRDGFIMMLLLCEIVYLRVNIQSGDCSDWAARSPRGCSFAAEVRRKKTQSWSSGSRQTNGSERSISIPSKLKLTDQISQVCKRKYHNVKSLLSLPTLLIGRQFINEWESEN